MSGNSPTSIGGNRPPCIETAVLCDGCLVDTCPTFDLVTQRAQAIGRVLALEEENEALRLANSDLHRARELDSARARRDRKLEGFWNMDGIGYMLETDESLRQEFLRGTCGLISMDVRGLRWVNNDDNHEVGDIYLRILGDRILGQGTKEQPALIRIANREHDNENRPVEPRPLDLIFFHISGDEFGIIVRNCTPAGLQIVRDRIQSAFSIEQAIQTGERSGIPLAASVGAVHARELPMTIPNLCNPEITTSAQDVGLHESTIAHQVLSRAIENSFYTLAKEADNRAIEVRKDQYRIMLKSVIAHHEALLNDPALDARVHGQLTKELDLCGVFVRDFSEVQIRQSDFSTAIFKLFLNTFNHAFYTNRVAMLQEADRQRRARAQRV